MKTEIMLSEDQEKAVEALIEFKKNPGNKKYITLGGFAGTGKSTCISYLAGKLKEENDKTKIAFCAFTGKASSVLRSKLGQIPESDFCGTIHSLIYKPLTERGFVKGWVKVPSIDFNLIIIDEASMISRDIFQDISSYGIPIIAVGDHGQLMPIDDDFSLMKKPDIRLEKIHRQAEDNPIIKLSMIVRKEGAIRGGQLGPGVSKLIVQNIGEALSWRISPTTLYLCAYNSTRVYVNTVVRSGLGIKSKSPIKGDKIICLRNNRNEELWNGQISIINKIESGDKERYKMSLAIEGNEKDLRETMISKFQFGQKNMPNNWKTKTQGNLFDYGYCLTIHKSQGSESADVILIEERLPEMTDDDYARLLYTGITRAKNTITILKRG